jgi:pyruvate ferredoxin oxidoreductase gamma subunit
MFSVRFHGRGGQGVVTAAEMLSVAAFEMGRYAQAFPTFGSERTGAPVVSFCRIHDRPITFHEPIDEPDALVVQDPTLLRQVPILDDVLPSTYLLVNTARSLSDLGVSASLEQLRPERVAAVPATDLARELLGRPLPNTALLGAFAALTDLVSLDALEVAIRARFGGQVAAGNVAAARRAYADVKDGAHIAREVGHA